MAKLGWGIIGIGNIVQGTMAPAMVAEEECEIVAGVSRDQGRAEAFAEKFGARHAYTDYAEMLANPEVEAVFIATPNALHADQVVQAAQAGKHVLCDKPLATTFDDAQRAYEACVEAGVRLGINFHNRQLPWVRDVRELIREGAIGSPQVIHVEASAARRPPVDWRADAQLSGQLGTAYSQGVHVYDFLRFVLDANPVDVVAVLDDENGAHEVETTALTIARFDNGTTVYCNINQANPHPQNDIAIYGSEGRIIGKSLTRSRFDGELHVLTSDGERVEPYENPSGLAHQRNIAAFTRSILAGEQPNASGEDGLYSTLFTEAMKTSATDRRVVDLDNDRIAAIVRGG